MVSCQEGAAIWEELLFGRGCYLGGCYLGGCYLRFQRLADTGPANGGKPCLLAFHLLFLAYLIGDFYSDESLSDVHDWIHGLMIYVPKSGEDGVVHAMKKWRIKEVIKEGWRKGWRKVGSGSLLTVKFEYGKWNEDARIKSNLQYLMLEWLVGPNIPGTSNNPTWIWKLRWVSNYSFLLAVPLLSATFRLGFDRTARWRGSRFLSYAVARACIFAWQGSTQLRNACGHAVTKLPQVWRMTS
jgi:hypothetical protein